MRVGLEKRVRGASGVLDLCCVGRNLFNRRHAQLLVIRVSPCASENGNATATSTWCCPKIAGTWRHKRERYCCTVLTNPRVRSRTHAGAAVLHGDTVDRLLAFRLGGLEVNRRVGLEPRGVEVALSAVNLFLFVSFRPFVREGRAGQASGG